MKTTRNIFYRPQTSIIVPERSLANRDEEIGSLVAKTLSITVRIH